MFETETQAVNYVCDVVTERVKTLFQRTRERVVELGIIRGVEVPNAVDWHLDPRYACGGPVDPEFGLPIVSMEFREVYDEHLPFDQYQKVSLEGYPF